MFWLSTSQRRTDIWLPGRYAMRWPSCSDTWKQDKKLPLVIPVLFYTGKRRPYPYSTRWLDEFDDPALAGRLYSSAFPLADVTVIPHDKIAGHRSMATLTLLQKHIHRAGFGRTG